MKEIKAVVRDWMETISSELMFCLLIAFVVVGLPVTEIFDETQQWRFASQPTIVLMAGIFGLIMIAAHFLTKKDNRYYFSDISFLLLMVLAIVSAFLTQNPEETFNGFDYDELLQHFWGYFCLMMAGTIVQKTEYRKAILKCFVWVTVIQCAIAVPQTFGVKLEECAFDANPNVCYGLTQNPNFYGGLSVILFAATSGFFLFTGNKLAMYTTYMLSQICVYTLLSSESRLAWVGVFAILVFYPVSFLIMKKKGYSPEKLRSLWKRFGALLIGMVVVTAFTILVCGKVVGRVQRSIDEINRAEGAEDGIGTHRLVIWRAGLEIFPQYWAFGIGLDNYRDAFRINPNVRLLDWSQAKAHNEYIHYLVTQGLFQFLNYMTMLVLAAVTGIRTVIKTEDEEERYLTWILLAMFFGYAAQAFFNSSIVNVAPYFWVTVGMLLTKKHQRPLGFRKQAAAAAKSA